MKNLIVANWKLNPTTKKEAEDIFKKIKKGAGKTAEVVVCPPFVYISDLAHLSSKALSVGGQNVYFEEKGAFTGEISPAMLKKLGVEYVIIGHSERRKYFGETDETINKKIKAAINVELEQIFCVGETDEERSQGRAEEVVENQIKKGLQDVTDVAGMAVAYEPVWAIGTGKNCGIEDAKKMREFIQKIISGIYGADILDKVRILYGGSVKAENSQGYLKEAGYGGLLVGGASLNPEEFVKIIKSAE